MQDHEERNSRENPGDPNELQFIPLSPCLIRHEDLNKLYCNCVSFPGSFSPPLSAFCVALGKTAVQSLARRELLGGKNQALLAPLAVPCCRDLPFGAGGHKRLPPGSELGDLSSCKKKAVDKFSLSAWHARQPFSLLMQGCVFSLI